MTLIDGAGGGGGEVLLLFCALVSVTCPRNIIRWPNFGYCWCRVEYGGPTVNQLWSNVHFLWRSLDRKPAVLTFPTLYSNCIIILNAQYHRQHSKLHTFEQFGAMYTDSQDNMYTRPYWVQCAFKSKLGTISTDSSTQYHWTTIALRTPGLWRVRSHGVMITTLDSNPINPRLNTQPIRMNYHIIPKENIGLCIQHHWEGVMGSSQHKSPYQARAFRRGLHLVKSAEISPSRRTQRCSMHSLVRRSISNGKIKLCSEAYRRKCEMGWSHHTSRSESQQHECEKESIRL